MIINTNQDPEAQYVGNIKANKVGIDTKNIDFIASLLTTNLYSNPIMSFIRETVSNGWDSHVEAKVQQPVLISLYSTLPGDKFRENTSYSWGYKVPLEITIRDFGVGLSPDRFAAIYTNIGSSTKRDSNDFIGCFGIGRFSCLSCADSATLTSYYNGTKYSYLMYKDGSSINIDELGQFPTTERNGLAVKVSLQVNRNDMIELRNGIEALAYFNCIYIDDPLNLMGTFSQNFNSRITKEYNTFSIWDMPRTPSFSITRPDVVIRVGNCIYPLTKTQLLSDVEFPSHWNIAIKFKIGELSVTPNREAILYNQKTDDIIRNRCKEVLEEIKNLFMQHMNNLDFSNILQWYKFVSTKTHHLSLPLNPTSAIELAISDVMTQKWAIRTKTCKINGTEIPSPKIFSLMSSIMRFRFPKEYIKFCYYYDTGKFYSEISSHTSLDCDSLIGKHQVIVTSDVKWKSILRDYVKQKIVAPKKQYGSYFLVLNKKNAEKYFIYTVKKLLRLDTSPKKCNTRFILKNLDLDAFFPEINETSISSDYREQWEKEKQTVATATTSSQKKPARKCVIYTLTNGSTWDYSLGKYKTVLNSDIYSLDKLQTCKRPIVYSTNDSDEVAHLKDWYTLYYQYINIVKDKCPIFVAVAPNNIPTIAALPTSKSIDEFINERHNELEILTSIDFDKFNLWKDTKPYIGIDLPTHFSTLFDQYKRYNYLCSLIEFKREADIEKLASVSPILDKYRKLGWINKEIVDYQNNDKLWALLKFIRCVNYTEGNAMKVLIVADYIQRIGLGDMPTKLQAMYKKSDFYKHLIN